MRVKFSILLFFFATTTLIAQTYSIKGRVQESGSKTAIPNATILLLRVNDSTQVDGMISDLDGNFEIDDVREGEYLLKVQYLGYQNLFRSLQVARNIDLGVISIQEEATALEEVTISARRSTSQQKSDTTLYNADAFKTMRDASAQTLIEKLPGVTSADGALQAQGENIGQILVDGKPFFGTDVRTALQNLPAEVIQSIEIFDQLSEKARLSGFDDGERLKTINIITKPNRRKGQFGRTSAGYGSDDRYVVGASINAFNEDQRITFTGLSNNINLTDYSSDPNAQDNARPQNGIINTNLAGLNYSDLWGKKIKVSGSYVFSSRENIGQEIRFREFITNNETDQFYEEVSNDTRLNNQHQFDMRFEYNIDEKNRILYIPRFSARFETENSDFFGETTNGVDLINSVENTRTSKNKDYDLFNRFFYSHKFDKPGRTMTVRARLGNNANEDRANRLAENQFFSPTFRTETINQQINRDRTGLSWETGISFTEAVSERSQFELEYEIGNRINDSDQLIFDVIDETPGDPELRLDTALSNTFESKFLTQEVELGYQYSKDGLRFQVEGQYQNAKLDNSQGFPLTFDLLRTFQSFQPSVRIDYKFSDNTNIEFDYDTRTNEPNLRQLQPVVDNSNPLQLYVGNPDLDQSYSNRLRVRFRSNNPETDRNWFLFAQSSFVKNTISNSSFIAQEATEIENGIILEQGSQLFRPVNLDGYWDFRSWLSYGIPAGFIKSNFNMNFGAAYTKRPTLVNQQNGFNNSRRLSTGFSISSNISDQIDFNIWTRFSFNDVENTLNPNLNNKFFNQRGRINFNWIIWEGFVYRLDLTHQVNSGLSEGFDTNFTLVNMSLGKKIFNNQRGEISLNVYDLFRQNNNIRRNISETFIEDVQTNVLQRYVMLTFSYNIRRFSKGMDMDDYQELINTGNDGSVRGGGL
ncbi:MAG TPA: TonB-dependent receptor [Algoriphagus sp.]|uniref:outer membrane beta-barrel protein n=1 Tax=unclassified Algoriphagus TaxID=2641541 RepID=UPI000C65179E|nr:MULTISPECIES: outer membrane beta-barrel protein [unclassified Algoriphagus]MAL14487.1 TonB-dependent receptor [Algoriphagus sp.]HCB47574.1 TonB-dependent receptor [Algoriphagus sp.]HCD89937.1 TonB-dependent receptor [Algoriphagus sp.]HCH45642.1 TonB-dependent receptor [Algoriphagus sp.]|tara:strand:- start:411 stop:3188 length:2778 start_codon:yes stop_codon:yes gene_type:complete